MFKDLQILVTAIALAGSAAALTGCGQKGPLFLPTSAAAAQRATLPQTLRPRVLGGGTANDAMARPGTAPTPASDASNIPPPSPADLVPQNSFDPPETTLPVP